MHHLKDLRVAVLVMDGFEESELTEPVRALEEAGAVRVSRAGVQIADETRLRGAAQA